MSQTRVRAARSLAAAILIALSASVTARAQKPRLVVQTGHADSVNSVAFFRDGKTLASASTDGTVKLWDIKSGRELRSLSGHTERVDAMAVSPDGKKIASAGRGKHVRVWDAEDGRVLHTLEAVSLYVQEPNVSALAFSPNGKVLAGAAFDFICLWDVEKGGLVKTLKFRDQLAEPFSTLAFSPGGKSLVSAGGTALGGRGRIVMWDVAGGQPSWAIEGHKLEVRTAAFNSDGTKLATGGFDETIKLWSAQTGEMLKTLAGHKGGVHSVAFHPRGELLASAGSDGVAKLWDVAKGGERRTFGRAQGSYISSPVAVSFSPGGRTLAVGGHSGGGHVELWDVASGKVSARLIGKSNLIYSAAFSPSGEQLSVSYGDTRSAVWNLTGGKGPSLLLGPGEDGAFFTGSLNTGPHFPSYNPAGTLLADGDWENKVRVWDASKGTLVRTLAGHAGRIISTAYSPDGKTLASASEDKTIRLWDAEGGQLRTLAGHTDAVTAVAFSGDGKTLASASDDATIKLWDVERGEVVRTYSQHVGGVRALAFQPGGKMLASIASDNLMLLWNTETDETPRGLRFADDIGSMLGGGILASKVRSVAFSPDGKLFTAGTGGPVVTLWNVETGKVERHLMGHAGGVISVSFAPGGRMLATAGLDRTVKLWDVASGEEICSLVALGPRGDWAVVKPDGRFDTNTLDSVESLHWVLPDAPFAPLPVEIFMRDYYEPRLLARLLTGEKLRDVRDLSQLNRTQPAVRIASVTPSREDFVTVAVEVASVRSDVQRGEGGKPLESGVYDVRLFRNGQLVGYGPTPDGAVKLTNGTAKLSFVVRLPGNIPFNDGKRWVEFSAYAFNADRVKSDTARRLHDVPPRPIVIGPTARSEGPRAYLISVGVNTNETPRWKLLYAANDARAIQSVVGKRLRARQEQGWLADVVTVPLISDGGVRDATRRNFRAVLDLLAGRAVDDATRAAIPNATLLRKATPDDLVIISFSGHGYADEQGTFHLVPYDTGGSAGGTGGEAATGGCCLSSDDLSLWLRDVDAGELVMIIDACHSAAAVGPEFKPAPMGSRGLGQLAYDKGMRILAATQAADVALESGAVRQGLLTYALTQDGLEKGDADFKAKDGRILLGEWLEYATEQVPRLYERTRDGQLKAYGREVTVDEDGQNRRPSRKNPHQQPSLFDFSRSRSDVLLAESAQ